TVRPRTIEIRERLQQLDMRIPLDLHARRALVLAHGRAGQRLELTRRRVRADAGGLVHDAAGIDVLLLERIGNGEGRRLVTREPPGGEAPSFETKSGPEV